MVAAGLLDHPAIDRLRAELRSNPRVRWLLAGVGLILVFIIWRNLSDAIAVQRDELRRSSAQAARLETIAQESQWPERRSAAESLQAQLETRLWSGENESLAKSEYFDWISTTARNSGLGAVEVRTEIDSSVNNAIGAKKLSASVSGNFNAEAFANFLKALAQTNRFVVVERMQIHTLPLNRFDMTLITYLRPNAAKASGP